MREIERYIQFAIDNGYKLCSQYRLEKACKYPNGKSVIHMITSKEFIEAIARGVEYENLEWTVVDRCVDEIDNITIMQSLAIRDNELDTFITNLLGEN